MKIVLVTFRFDARGGAVAVPRALAHALVGRGHEVTVLTGHEDRRPSYTEEGGVRIFGFRPPNLYWVGDKDTRPVIQRTAFQVMDTWNPSVARMVSRVLSRLEPDVVHVHKLRGLSPSVWQAARWAQIPALVHTAHDYELISPQGTLEGRVGTWTRGGWWPMRSYQALRARASRSVDVVTAPSRYLLDTIRDRGMFPSAEARVVANFHDVLEAQLLVTDPGAASRGPVRLAFLGRLEPNKGISILLDALGRVQENCELIVAGWGSREPEVREASRRDRRIRFVGAVDDAGRDHALAMADALVVPSTWEETFGLVVVEAYARGTPVLVSRIGAFPELVRDGSTGWFFEPDSVPSLASTLRRAIKRVTELRSMRQACLDAARDYTLDRTVSAYMASYRQALERRASAEAAAGPMP